MMDPMEILKTSSAPVAPLPTVVPDVSYQKAGDVGNRTLW